MGLYQTEKLLHSKYKKTPYREKNFISDKGLVTKIHEELTTLNNNQRPNNSIKNVVRVG